VKTYEQQMCRHAGCVVHPRNRLARARPQADCRPHRPVAETRQRSITDAQLSQQRFPVPGYPCSQAPIDGPTQLMR
jgi:hypothetical protein